MEKRFNAVFRLILIKRFVTRHTVFVTSHWPIVSYHRSPVMHLIAGACHTLCGSCRYSWLHRHLSNPDNQTTFVNRHRQLPFFKRRHWRVTRHTSSFTCHLGNVINDASPGKRYQLQKSSSHLAEQFCNWANESAELPICQLYSFFFSPFWFSSLSLYLSLSLCLSVSLKLNYVFSPSFINLLQLDYRFH